VAEVEILSGKGAGTVVSPADPRAMAEAGGPYSIVNGDSLVLDASGSIDVDDAIVEYAWDFDADGLWDFVSARTGYTTHRFSRPGEYESVLRVTDSLGRTATDSMSVVVVAQQADLKAAESIGSPRKAATKRPPDGVRRWYAVILNGGYDERYWRDVELAYDMLTAEYGFSPADIYLLNYDGKNPSGANPDGMIDYPAKIEYIEIVFDQLSARVDGDDEVSVI